MKTIAMVLLVNINPDYFVIEISIFHLATLIFTNRRCLESKVIPKGFRSSSHASTFSPSNRQYLHEIQCAQNVFF